MTYRRIVTIQLPSSVHQTTPSPSPPTPLPPTGEGRDAEWLRRIEWIDCAKGIGILLVVYGHVARGTFMAGLTPNAHTMMLIDSVIYSFHMPLFFFLSGFSFRKSSEERDARTLISTRIGTLLYPYLVWSLLQGVVHVAMSRWTNQPRTLQDLLSIPWQPIGQFWFLLALFWVFALNALLATWLRSAALWVSLICALVLYSVDQPPFPLALPQAFAHLIFFNVGWFAAVYRDTVSRLYLSKRRLCFLSFEGEEMIALRRTGTTPLIALILMFILGEFWFHNAGYRYDQAPVSARLSLALIGIASVACLSVKLKGALLKALAFLGRHTMPIYLMHILAAAGMRIVLQKIFRVESLAIHLIVIMPTALLLPVAAYQLVLAKRAKWLFAPPGVWPAGKIGKVHEGAQ